MPKNRAGRVMYALFVVVALLIIGRNVYHRTVNGRLIAAVQARNVAGVRNMLAWGADPNAHTPSQYKFDSGTSVLSLAVNNSDGPSASAEIACLLMQHGARVDKDGREAGSDLLFACQRGSVALARCLLEHGVSANASDRPGSFNAVDAAIQYGNSFDGPILQTPPATWSEPQRLKMETNRKQHREACRELVRLLQAHGARLTLWQAIRTDDVNTLRALLDAGTPVESREPTNGTMTVAGKIIAEKGPTALEVAAQAGSLDCARLLLERGATVNAAGDFASPLTVAIVGRHLEMARLLLQRGAEVNVGNYSPLVSACTSLPELVPELLARTTDIKTAGGYALGAAISGRHPELVTLLLKHGASVRGLPGYSALSAAIQYQPELVPVFLAQGADARGFSSANAGLVLQAVRCGRANLIAPLVRAGAKVNYRTVISSGPVPNHAVPPSSTLLLEALAQGPEMIRALLEQGADPNMPNGMGETPLIAAAQSGKLEATRLLLAHKADVNDEGRLHHTPLFYARHHKHADIAALLQQAGGREK